MGYEVVGALLVGGVEKLAAGEVPELVSRSGRW